MLSVLGKRVFPSCVFPATKTNRPELPFTASRRINLLTFHYEADQETTWRPQRHCLRRYHLSKTEEEVRMQAPGVSLSTVVRALESFAPISLAEKWDNVGLLLAPEQGSEGWITKILLTNDLTEDVLKEAVGVNANLIISYHPPIFEAVKRITSDTWKGRILQTCLRKDIAIYSPHTSWDAVEGGVNDWLIQAFDAFKPQSEPIHQCFGPNKLATHTAEAVVPKEKSDYLVHKIKETLGRDTVGEIPYQMGNDEVVKITVPCKTKDIVPLTRTLQDFPHTFSKLEENPILNYGMGRSCVLGSPQKLEKILQAVKEHLNIPDVSLALARGSNLESIISTVGVCAGSGGSVLQGQKVDLIVTGEMSHHQVLDAVHQGVNVVLTRHSDSERGFLQHFVSTFLSKVLGGKVSFVISSKDADPLHTV